MPDRELPKTHSNQASQNVQKETMKEVPLLLILFAEVIFLQVSPQGCLFGQQMLFETSERLY
jgi:hypothetical protein